MKKVLRIPEVRRKRELIERPLNGRRANRLMETVYHPMAGQTVRIGGVDYYTDRLMPWYCSEKVKQPTVAAIMLVNGRAEMTARAVAAFHAQTYKGCVLIVFDSGIPRVPIKLGAHGIRFVASVEDDCSRLSFGRLRNIAVDHCDRNDIICHWDSDDWSHPRRIEEQVALLQSSGRPCVGYTDVLFWDTRTGAFDGMEAASIDRPRNEAWRYNLPNPYQPVGASLCYWRTAWKEMPFEDIKCPDERWASFNNALGVSSLKPFAIDGTQTQYIDGWEPRMVCGLHGANFTTRIPENAIGKEWNRAREWDSYCAEAMKL